MLLLKLFPTPVAVFDFKPLSEEERSTIVNTASGNTTSTYLENVSSIDKNILKNEKLKRLREAIQTCIDRYKNEVMSCDQELYMTNSWVSFLLPQKKHPMHYHSNSIVSGVYYIKTDKETPDIEFEHPNTNLWRLTWKRKEFNHENNLSSFVKVRDNRLILFPSTLWHSVNKNFSSITRVSVSFNTFLRGDLDSNNYLAEVTLK
tara:strand:+ start:3848 stop:4459 length:612 start_codon:yes stop_codon:yes gene_type:complete